MKYANLKSEDKYSEIYNDTEQTLGNLYQLQQVNRKQAN